MDWRLSSIEQFGVELDEVVVVADKRVAHAEALVIVGKCRLLGFLVLPFVLAESPAAGSEDAKRIITFGVDCGRLVIVVVGASDGLEFSDDLADRFGLVAHVWGEIAGLERVTRFRG